jgi:outer membrane protein
MEAQLAAARFRQKSANATQGGILRQLVLSVGTAYWEVRRKELATSTRQTLLHRFRDLELLTQQRVNAGLVPVVDYDRARAQTLEVELELTQTARELATARATLAAVLHSDGPFELTDDVPDAASALPSLDEALRIAQAERPELAAADADTHAAAQDLRAAKGGYWPQLAVVATADYVTGSQPSLGTPGTAAATVSEYTTTPGAPPTTTTSYYGGVQMRWNVFEMMSTWMNVRQAKLTHQRVEAQQERARQDVLAEVRTAHAQLVAALRARAATRQLVGLARNDLQLLWKAYSVGATKMVEVIAAQKELLQREIQLIDNSVDLVEADLGLQTAMGRY